jgi:hypothetical protein
MKTIGRIVCLCALLAAACSDDGAAAVDASPIDADITTCKVQGNYASLGAVTGSRGITAGGDLTVTITLDAGPPRDLWFLKLTASKGVFADGVKAGTYSIAGVDTDFNNCGLCVTLIADLVTGQGPSKFYQATSGQVTLTSIGSPLTGTVSNLVFGEVSLAGVPVPGCTSAIASASFAGS